MKVLVPTGSGHLFFGVDELKGLERGEFTGDGCEELEEV